MIGAEQAIASGYGAFKRADYESARKALSGIAHPQAIHLLGLVEKGAGNYAAAKAHLERAAKLDGANPEIANNQGLLARLMGEMTLAEVAFRRALALKPDFRSAQLSLGRTLHNLGKYKEAMAVLEPLITHKGTEVAARVAFANSALELKEFAAARVQIEAALIADPQDIAATYASGVLAFNTDALERAEVIFTRLLSQNRVLGEANYMMARLALVRGEVSKARGYAQASFQFEPASENFLTLADILWMSNDLSAFESLLMRALTDPSLALHAIGLMRKSGRQSDALSALEAQPVAVRNAPQFQALRSALLLDMGDVDGAVAAGRAGLSAALEAGAGAAQHAGDHYDLVRALLAAGEVGDALDLIGKARAVDPLSQFWLGYEATALRMMGDARYGDLLDYQRHVRSYELPVPEGFDSLAAFNAALLSVLSEMNPFKSHPLNQSLRGGAQTPHDLCLSSHPVLQAYFKALDAPIRDYMAALGTMSAHPSAARNTGEYKISGAWSVRLDGGGHHVNHVHPRGWISSAYYVAVPPETAAGNDKSGWIKFGEPPIATKPVLGPEKWVQPRAGMLVLFPSFLWHGTEPIHDGAVRVTAPFDVVPR